MTDTIVKYRRDINQLLPDIANAVCAELGVAEGLFARDILAWGIKRLYAIDLWESNDTFPGDAGNVQEWHDKNYNKAKELFAPYGERVVILRGPTVRMAQMINEPLDFVNVDACHAYHCVLNDAEAYWPLLKPGGIMAFHDYEAWEYKVKEAVGEFARRQGLQIHLLPEDKPQDAGAYLIKP